MSWFSQIKELHESKKQIGQKVEKVGVLPVATGSDNLYTVSGGRVLLVDVEGEVTAAPAGTAATILARLRHTPTLGAAVATNMCTDLDIKGAVAETLLHMTGAVNVALASDAAAGVAIPSFVTNRQILQPGTVSLLMTEGAGAAGDITGSVTWTLFYLPIDDGAVITAAP